MLVLVLRVELFDGDFAERSVILASRPATSRYTARSGFGVEEENTQAFSPPRPLLFFLDFGVRARWPRELDARAELRMRDMVGGC